MEIFPETKDPDEIKDYRWDWTPEFAEGEIIQSQEVEFIDAAGTQSPSNSPTERISTVWLSGGTHGSRVIFSLRIVTDQGRTLEKALAVDIVDTLLAPAPETDVDRLRRLIREAADQRAHVAMGNAVIDVWRDGRRLRKHIPSLRELDTYIATLERQLEKATAATEGRPARRAIGLAWRN